MERGLGKREHEALPLLSSGGTLGHETLGDASCWARRHITRPRAEPSVIRDGFVPLQDAFLLQRRVVSLSLACVSLGV